MRLFAAALLATLTMTLTHAPAWATGEAVTVYKSPYCGCCTGWVKHMQDEGFDVTVKDVEDLTPVKTFYKVAPEMASCHTAVVDGYVVEGHVPAHVVRRLLDEKPETRGISLPGMPTGVPGMDGPDQGPYVYYTLDDEPKVYLEE